MVTILATVGWLLFDVAVSIMTAGYLPLWEWRALFWGGGTLALLTLIGMIWDYRAHKKDVAAHEQGIADIRAGQAGHTGEIATVAKGSIAIFNKLDQLAGITQTTGQPLATVIETAISKIAQLETKVLRHDAIFWGAISDAEKLKLVNIFTGLGPHSVKIASNGNTDCVELARDLKDCFKKAGWNITTVDLYGDTDSFGVSGFHLTTKHGKESIHYFLVDALAGTIRGAVFGIRGGPPVPDDVPDISIVVGTKRIRTEDD